MLVETIREFNHRVPFEPYEIRMAGGESYPVPHPDFVLVSRRGQYVIVADAKDRPRHLSTLLIEQVYPLRNGGRRRAKKHA